MAGGWPPVGLQILAYLHCIAGFLFIITLEMLDWNI
jgi:hypothetical protein